MKTATRQTSREGPHQTVPLTVRTATGKQLIQMGFTARSRLETAMQLAPARHDRAAICIAPAEQPRLPPALPADAPYTRHRVKMRIAAHDLTSCCNASAPQPRLKRSESGSRPSRGQGPAWTRPCPRSSSFAQGRWARPRFPGFHPWMKQSFADLGMTRRELDHEGENPRPIRPSPATLPTREAYPIRTSTLKSTSR